MIMFKDVGVKPLPDPQREPGARWDAYLNVPDPDVLPAEFSSRRVECSEPLKATADGLRGFELKYADGCVLFSAVLVHGLDLLVAQIHLRA
jgi:hypothetical protein